MRIETPCWEHCRENFAAQCKFLASRLPESEQLLADRAQVRNRKLNTRQRQKMLVAALSLGLPPPPNHTLAELQAADALPHAPTSSYSSSLQPATDPAPRSREMLLAELVQSLEGDNAQLRRSEERARAEAEAARAEQQREGAELREARGRSRREEGSARSTPSAEALSQKRASADGGRAAAGLAALKVREEQVAAEHSSATSSGATTTSGTTSSGGRRGARRRRARRRRGARRPPSTMRPDEGAAAAPRARRRRRRVAAATRSSPRPTRAAPRIEADPTTGGSCERAPHLCGRGSCADHPWIFLNRRFARLRYPNRQIKQPRAPHQLRKFVEAHDAVHSRRSGRRAPRLFGLLPQLDSAFDSSSTVNVPGGRGRTG